MCLYILIWFGLDYISLLKSEPKKILSNKKFLLFGLFYFWFVSAVYTELDQFMRIPSSCCHSLSYPIWLFLLFFWNRGFTVTQSLTHFIHALFWYIMTLF